MCKKIMQGLLGGGAGAMLAAAPKTGTSTEATPNPTVVNPGAVTASDPFVRKAVNTPRTTNGVPGLNL